MITSYRDLDAWQLGMSFVESIARRLAIAPEEQIVAAIEFAGRLGRVLRGLARSLPRDR